MKFNKIKLLKMGIAIVLTCIFVVSVFFLLTARKEGIENGRDYGKKVGIATGSFNGITKGLSEGYQAGVSDAISAEDTAARLGNEIKEIGLLEVLQMDVTLPDIFQIGEGEKAYRALLIFEGTARYTVDLTKCNITYEGNTINIFAPRPVLHISLDPRGTQKQAETAAVTLAQKINDGDTLNTYQAFLNTYEVTEKKVRENLTNYEFLNKSAIESAKTAIENLARSAVLNGKQVEVSFFDDNDSPDIELEV